MWAPENTREAIFDALARRETYATSGPRVAVRFYAGWGIDDAVMEEQNPFQSLMADGVPMGGVLHIPKDANAGAATFPRLFCLGNTRCH